MELSDQREILPLRSAALRSHALATPSTLFSSGAVFNRRSYRGRRFRSAGEGEGISGGNAEPGYKCGGPCSEKCEAYPRDQNESPNDRVFFNFCPLLKKMKAGLTRIYCLKLL